MAKKIAVLIITSLMILIAFSGCLGSTEQGWSSDQLVAPEYQMESHDNELPSPLSPQIFLYSFSLIWTMSEVYETYGGVMNLTMENAGVNTIYVYGFGLKWVNSTVMSNRETSVYVRPGETSELGLLFFRAPDDDMGIYEVHVWICVSNAGETKWYDHGDKKGSDRAVSLKPRLAETNYTVERNPSSYFNRVNDRVSFEVVEDAVSEIRSLYPLDRSVNQIVGAFEWMKDNIRYAQDDGGDYWQSASETLEKGKGDCEDQAILMASLLGALGLNGRVNIIEHHAFATVFISQNTSEVDEVREVIESLYWTDLPICYLEDDLGYWMVTDTTGFFYAGGLPVNSGPLKGPDLNAWTFEDTGYLISVDATGQSAGLDLWPF